MGLMAKLFGSYSDKELRRLEPQVDKILSLEQPYGELSDAELRAKTDEFKQRLSDGETLDDILPEAFAAIREAAWRVVGMKPFPVQLQGGIVLHQGRIAEMRTGEGKTLVAVLPAYLNALNGKGVHIVTVNDYLAKRDSEWMGKVYQFMGISVGLIIHEKNAEERKQAYACDVTYGTNNEMGFDYLRDNMAVSPEQLVQRGHEFAIVDEVDSILIDEARTPLIISGPGTESTALYRQVDNFVSGLTKVVYTSTDSKEEEDEDLDADYIVDEKLRTATLTARGIAKAEKYFGLENLADIDNATLNHHINQALRAHGIMRRDIDYIVKDGEVLIVDEFTGRIMLGRRYSEGLHQAIEAKEHVQVQKESQTLATITFQNYFRLYEKLSGMTGTAQTEALEFGDIYKLDVIEIPTNKPMIREDHPDCIYKNDSGKIRAIINQIQECHAKGQPVLVGTVSIEKSERLSSLLKKQGIAHNVLNAKQHEREAEIVAQAGKLGAVTIATNMAGRGTDIMLGGNPDYLARLDLKKKGYSDEVIAEATGYADTDNEDVLEARRLYQERQAQYKVTTSAEAEKVRQAGGLFILGTERHDARRIDNQLRGRAGRQGDPGESRFFLATTDDVMRLFSSANIQGLMERAKFDDDTPIENKMVTSALDQAQKNVEGRNYQARRSVLEFDDVMNKQRNIIYTERRKVLDEQDISGEIQSMLEEYVSSTVFAGLPEGFAKSQQELDEALSPFERIFLPRGTVRIESFGEEPSAEKISEAVTELARKAYAEKEKKLGSEMMRKLERFVLLRVVDEYWMEHIDAMDDLRQDAHLRAYANEKPIEAYTRDGYQMFEEMIAGIRTETVRRMLTVQVRSEKSLEHKTVNRKLTASSGGSDGTVKKEPVRRKKKPGPNDPCPCGKMKADGSRRLKYKECCGRFQR